MTALVAALCLARLDSEAPPFDYVRPAFGGKYLFVMLVPKANRAHAYDHAVFRGPQGWKMKRKDGLLFKKYPASGLYAKGSTRPLWTVDWYAANVNVCSDGQHLVRFGPWPRAGDGGNTLAIAFYRSGKLIRSDAVKDLITEFGKLPHSMSHYQWMRASRFDDKGKLVFVDTAAGFELEFNILNGFLET